jgi:hypothetical protein
MLRFLGDRQIARVERDASGLGLATVKAGSRGGGGGGGDGVVHDERETQ